MAMSSFLGILPATVCSEEAVGNSSSEVRVALVTQSIANTRYFHSLGISHVAAALQKEYTSLQIRLFNFQYETDEDIVQCLLESKASIIGFSIFILTEERAIRLAHLIQKKNPNIICFAGGTRAYEAGPALLGNGFRFVIVGEGETPTTRAFKYVLQNEQIPKLPGVMTKTNLAPIIEREDLSKLPSPWLAGLIEPKEVVRWEIGRGCKFNCAYCVEMRGGSGVQYVPLERVEQELSYIVERYPDIKHINVIDSTVTLDRNRFYALLDLFYKYAPEYEWRITVRPEHLLNDVVIQKIAKLKHCVVSMGIQTFNPEAVKISHRPDIDKEQFVQLFKSLQNAEIDFTVDMIYGLPGETFESWKDGIHFLLKNRVHKIRFFPLALYIGSELYSRKNDLHLTVEPAGMEDRVIQTPTYSREDFNATFSWTRSTILKWRDLHKITDTDDLL